MGIVSLFMRIFYGLLVTLLSILLTIFGAIGVFAKPCNTFSGKLSEWIMRTLNRLYVHIDVQDEVFQEQAEQKRYEEAVAKAINEQNKR